MKRIIFLALILITPFLYQSLKTETKTTPTQNPTTSTLYTVTKVIDGDTVVIDRDGTDETLRLIGIDTPEVDARYNPVECYGKEATEETKRLVSGKQVRIESDSSQSERDAYNRLLVYLFLEDGTNVNEHLVRQGYAKEYTFKNAYMYQDTFKRAEQEAKEDSRGLWSEEHCPLSE